MRQAGRLGTNAYGSILSQEQYLQELGKNAPASSPAAGLPLRRALYGLLESPAQVACSITCPVLTSLFSVSHLLLVLPGLTSPSQGNPNQVTSFHEARAEPSV